MEGNKGTTRISQIIIEYLVVAQNLNCFPCAPIGTIVLSESSHSEGIGFSPKVLDSEGSINRANLQASPGLGSCTDPASRWFLLFLKFHSHRPHITSMRAKNPDTYGEEDIELYRVKICSSCSICDGVPARRQRLLADIVVA